MKSLLVVGLVVALSGCGEFKELPPQVSNGNGGTVGAGSTYPQGDKEDGNWRYSSVKNSGGEVFNAKAENSAINTYPDPEVSGLNARPFVIAERQRLLPSTASESIKIFTGSAVACVPTCQIPIKFNSNRQSYLMQYSTLDEVLVPVSAEVGKDLFDKFTRSNSAVITLPIIGLSDKVDSEFNLRGYEADRMKLSIDSL
jgi:hypothetical protein